MGTDFELGLRWISDPWEEELIEQGIEEWTEASAVMDAVSRLAEMLDFILGRLPNQHKEEKDHE